jgi:hypothetical protein
MGAIYIIIFMFDLSLPVVVRLFPNGGKHFTIADGLKLLCQKTVR